MTSWRAGPTPTWPTGRAMTGCWSWVTVTDPSTSQTFNLGVYTPATQLGFSGPSSGTVGVASSNFMLTPDHVYTGTITPTDHGGGGPFSPTSLTWSGDNSAKTLTYTPGSAGSKSIGVTGATVQVVPSSLTYQAIVKSQIVFVGDSWTYGVNASGGAGTTGGTCSPGSVIRGLGSANWDGTNLGTQGWWVGNLVADKPVHVDPLYSPGRPLNIAVVLIGINNLGGGQTPAQVYSQLVAYCQSLQAGGWKVVVCTLPSADYQGTVEDTSRDTYNSSIRSGWTGFADALADVASDPHLGPDGSYSNTTWYSSDQLHLSDAGYASVATVVLGALAQFSKVAVAAGTSRPRGILTGGAL